MSSHGLLMFFEMPTDKVSAQRSRVLGEELL